MFFINSERLLQGILPQVSETSIFVRLLSLINFRFSVNENQCIAEPHLIVKSYSH